MQGFDGYIFQIYFWIIQSLKLKTLDIVTWNPHLHRQKSLTDRMMMMMEKYTHHLEELVDEKTAQLQVEKMKADKLL